MQENELASRRFLFILGSNRTGNSEALARHAAAALPGDVYQDWKRLSDLPLAALSDPGNYAPAAGPQPTGNERVLLDATLRATDVVLVSPLYWYSVSASVKLYLDYWGCWLHIPQVGFRSRMRGKVMWSVTATADDPEKAGPLVESLKLSAEYLGMKWGGEVVGRSCRPGDVHAEAATIERAKMLFQGTRR